MAFFESEIVQTESKKLFEDYQSLVKMGEQYGKFDREGKLLYIEQMEAVMDRYRIFLKRVELSDDFTAQMSMEQLNGQLGNFADGYYGRGVANEKLGEQQKAMADYDRAIELNPNLPSAYNNRGLLRFNLGDNQGAIADYDRSIENNPNAPNVFNNRGLARFKLGNKEAAIGDYDLAINLQPDYAEAYNNRGMALAALKDWPRAKNDYDLAIKFNPKLAEPYNNRGTARLSMQDWKGAITDFDRAIQINPKLAISYASRGLIKFIKLGDKPAAIADLQTAKTLFEQQGNKKLYKVTSEQLNKIQSSNSQSSAP